MALYAIGDLHLSFGSNKPMDIFGKIWDGHAEKLIQGFGCVGPEDVCVICGDLSWAMSLERPGGFSVHRPAPGEEDHPQGQPRLLVEHRLPSQNRFCPVGRDHH
jgi:hypothetical protein